MKNKKWRSNKIKARVFIVGCPRSGTTLLQSLLLQHPKINSFPESHFFRINRFNKINWFQQNRAYNSLLDWNETLRNNGFKNIPKAMYSANRNKIIKQFIQQLDEITVFQGKSVWVEKTPSHLYEIKSIIKVLPEAKFIHLIRNGEDVVSSLYDVTNKYPSDWGKRYSIHQAIERYNRDINISKSWIGIDNHIFIFYEDLIDKMQKTINGVYSSLGLDNLKKY